MERLTRRSHNGAGIYNTSSGDPVKWENNRHRVLQKLANYEDLEEQGLLIRLPVKVGSSLYRIYRKPTKCTAYGKVKDFYNCQNCEKECDASYKWDIHEYENADIKTIVCLSDEIGKTVFLMQAEAEESLRKMEEQKNVT